MLVSMACEIYIFIKYNNVSMNCVIYCFIISYFIITSFSPSAPVHSQPWFGH